MWDEFLLNEGESGYCRKDEMSRIIICILLVFVSLASGSTDVGFSVSNNGEAVGTETSLDLGTGISFYEEASSCPLSEDPFIVDSFSMEGSGKADVAKTIGNGDMSVTLTSSGTWVAGSIDRCATVLPGYIKAAQKFDIAGYDLYFSAEAISGTKSSKVWMTATKGELAGCQEAFATPSSTGAFQVGSAFI